MKIKEITENRTDQAFQLGFNDATQGNIKGKSINPRIKDQGTIDKYNAGWAEGKASEDHDAWQEKTASARQGRHYHESVNEAGRTEHKGYYDESGAYYDSKEAYDEHMAGKEPTDDTITANVD